MQQRRRDLPPLDLLRGFEAAARHLSFTKAAAELFLTQSAISRQVQALEESLGVALFQRRHRALLLTDAGQQLQRVAADVLRQLREAVEHIAGGSRRLTVTTMVTFASLWLVPRLPAFRRAHPDIDVHISANNELVDLERSRIDVAIRYLPRERAPAGAQPLFGEEVLPVCAPALLARGPALRAPADLREHVLLHMDDARVFNPYLDWGVWLEAMGLAGLKPKGALYFSHYDQMIHAAQEGQGVALGRTPLLSRHLRERRLVAPFETAALTASPRSSRAYFVVTASASAARPDVAAFLAWLDAEARSDVRPDAPAAPPTARSARSSRARRSRGDA